MAVVEQSVYSGVNLSSRLELFLGDIAISTTIRRGGVLVLSGGAAEYSTVRYDGRELVYSGGVAVSTAIVNGGYQEVLAGGAASSTKVSYGGEVMVFAEGSLTSAVVGGVLTAAGGEVESTAIVSGGSAEFASGAVGRGLLVSEGAGVYVSSGAELVSGKLASGAWIDVLSGGRVTDLLQTGGGALVFSVTSGDSATVISGVNLADGTTFSLASGGASGFSVYNNGVISVGAGASAADLHVYYGGNVTFSVGASGNAAVDGGYWDGSKFSLSGSVASGFRVFSGGRLTAASGGTALKTELFDGATLSVLASGTVSASVVSDGGLLVVSRNGSALGVEQALGGNINAYVLGGDGTVISGVNESGAFSLASGVASNFAVYRNGYFSVGRGGVAIDTTVSDGGKMLVFAGAALSGTVNVGGRLLLAGSAAADDCSINFDLSGKTDFDGALVNHYAFVAGADFTVTVDGAVGGGTYALMDNAAGFTASVGLISGDANVAVLTLDREVHALGRLFELEIDSGTLELSVTSTVADRCDLDRNGFSDLLMTISDTAHPHYGATGAWLISSEIPVWDDLSTLSDSWKLFGTGRTGATSFNSDVYLYNDDLDMVGAWTVDAGGKVTGWETVGTFDSNTNVLGLGDFNGDGQTDLLLQNTNGMVGCYLTSGTGWREFAGLGAEWSIDAIGDFNGDGVDDVALRNATGYAGTWLVGENGSLTWANLDTLSAETEIVGSGDFNGDGVDDILLQTGNYVGAWLVENGSVKSFMGLGTMTSGNVVETIADYDGDGIDDLRIRTAAGDLGALCVKGDDHLDWVYFGSVGSEWSTALAAI